MSLIPHNNFEFGAKITPLSPANVVRCLSELPWNKATARFFYMVFIKPWIDDWWVVDFAESGRWLKRFEKGKRLGVCVDSVWVTAVWLMKAHGQMFHHSVMIFHELDSTRPLVIVFCPLPAFDHDDFAREVIRARLTNEEFLHFRKLFPRGNRFARVIGQSFVGEATSHWAVLMFLLRLCSFNTRARIEALRAIFSGKDPDPDKWVVFESPQQHQQRHLQGLQSALYAFDYPPDPSVGDVIVPGVPLV